MKKILTSMLSLMAFVVCCCGFSGIKGLPQAKAASVQRAEWIETTTEYGADWQSSGLGKNGYVVFTDTTQGVYSNLYTESGAGYSTSDLITLNGWQGNSKNTYLSITSGGTDYVNASSALNLGIDRWAFCSRAWKAGATNTSLALNGLNGNPIKLRTDGWKNKIEDTSIVINKTSETALYFTAFVFAATPANVSESAPFNFYVRKGAYLGNDTQSGWTYKQVMDLHYPSTELLGGKTVVAQSGSYVTFKLEGTGLFQIAATKGVDVNGEVISGTQVPYLGGFFLDNQYEEPERTFYNISYQVGDGQNAEENTVTSVVENGWVSLYDPIPPAEYLFDGWYTSEDYQADTKVSGIYQVKDNVTFYAKYKPIVYYNVTYNVGGGQNHAENTLTRVMQGATITLEEPIPPEHYGFVGWYTTEDYQATSKVSGEFTVNENVIFYAKYEELSNENISYVLNGGVNAESNPTKYYIGEGIAMLAPASKEGYAFVGWYFDEAFNVEATGIPANMTTAVTLYARFEILPVISSITYHLDGGVNAKGNPSEYAEGEALSLLAATKENYAFDGWYLDAKFTQKVTEISATTTGAVVLYAKFISVAVYSDIIYELNGGMNALSNPNSYKEGTVVALADATKQNHIFGGWYLDAEFTQKVTEISAAMTGTVVLYAKFTAEEVTPPPAPPANNQSQSSGCGSVMISGSIISALVLLSLGVLLRKKED